MPTRNREIVGVVNPLLTEFATGYKNAQFIADLVVPSVESLTESGTILTFGKAGFKLYDTNRAPRANSRKIDWYNSKVTYICAEHSLETSLDWEKEIKVAEKYGAQKVLDLKKRSLRTVEKALAVDKEKAVADILFGSSYYATGNKVSLTGTDVWTDTTNSDPIGNISDGKKAARDDMGIEPNTLVLGYLSWVALKNHPALTGKIKNAKSSDEINKDAQEILDIEKIIIGKAVYAGDEGKLAEHWTDNAALIYTPNTGEEAEDIREHTVLIKEVGYPLVKEYSSKYTLDMTEFQKWVVKNLSTSNGYLIINTNA